MIDFSRCDVSGLADSTKCIQDGIAFVSRLPAGGAVKIPPGVFKISSTLIFGGKKDIYLKGAGIATAVIKATRPLKVAIHFGDKGICSQGTSDLTVDLSDASDGDGILIKNVNTFSLEYEHLIKPNIGINIQNGVVQYYRNFFIENPAKAGAYLHGGNDQFLRTV